MNTAERRLNLLQVWAGMPQETARRLTDAWGAELTPVEQALVEAVDSLSYTQQALDRASQQLTEQATRTVAYLAAKPGEPVYPIRTLGQTADDFNRLVGVHEGQARLVQTLGRLAGGGSETA